MQGRLSLVRSTLGLLLVLGGHGCASNDSEEIAAEEVSAHVLALSTYEASLSTMVEVYGHFPETALGHTRLVFNGTFTNDRGQTNPVDLEVTPRRVDNGTLRWTSFGPYAIPFSASGDETGTFSGTVTARVVTPDGRMIDDASPTSVDFKVLPSLIVRELQPVTASCNGPIQRALSDAPYRLQVEAVGFDPVSYTYTIAAPALGMEPVSIRRLANGRFDSLGDDGDFVLPPVPTGMPSYTAVITIRAKDEQGDEHQAAFAIGVHRPLEVFYNGNVEIAEVLPATPVSGCIPGGPNGRDAIYSESTAETLSRSYSVNWNQSWLNSHSTSEGTSSTRGTSETNGVGFSTSDGENWHWNVGGEVQGRYEVKTGVEGSVGVAGGSVDTTVGVQVSVRGEYGEGGSRMVNNSTDRTTGLNESESTTETESDSESVGGGQGRDFAWSASSSDFISRGFGGHVVAGTYGVFYRQSMRLVRRAAVVTYNQCGAATVVADIDFTDWAWSPDLALGESCPPLPQTNLPPAECLIPPCSGD